MAAPSALAPSLRWPWHAEVPRPMAADDEVAALVRLLCRYWRRNPLACDTAAGIAAWWLPRDRVTTVKDVKAALQVLEAIRYVERFVGGDGHVHYRLKAELAAHPGLLDAVSGKPNGGIDQRTPRG